MKILISWWGFNEDFIKKGINFQINPSGFSVSIHKDIIDAYKFDKHIILSTIDSSNTISKELKTKKYLLKDYLIEYYPKHKFEIFDLGIDKVNLQNYPIIESCLRSFIQQFDAKDHLYVVAGTGPTAVGMAWSSLNIAMNKRFMLYLLQRPEYSPQGVNSTLVEIIPKINQWLDDKLKENYINLELPSDIYKDDIVVKEYAKAKAIAPTRDINVLLLGETGCGKDKMAEFIVSQSPHNITKYKPINCASLPDDLLYSELFGHTKGAFTGANEDRTGLFEECNGGTIFMDEIGDISPFMQQSLLRAIENKEIKKAGSNVIEKNILVRIISATNNNLYEKCKKRKFRFDLYYRICGQEIELQSYRSRTRKQRIDIINYYLSNLESRWGKKINFSEQALKIIESYSFPGNFREIHNTINGLYALGIDIITDDDLPRRFVDKESELDESYETAHQNHCIMIYNKYKFDLAATRKALGYKNSSQLKNKLIEWGCYKVE